MAHNSTAIILINVGSPKSTSTKDVRQYLRQFLNNPRVIDMACLPRWLLVNLIIAPFRAPKSAKLYKQIWFNNSFPLLHYAQRVKNMLQDELANSADVFIGMNYGQYPLNETLNVIQHKHYDHLIIVPLFPQYASSSTGAAIEAALHVIKSWTVMPEIKVINQFYRHPLFIKAFTEKIKVYQPDKFDHIIFTYHGLPLSHLQHMCTSTDCTTCGCEQHLPSDKHTTCYKAACYETTRLIANQLSLQANQYSVGFQSRLSKKWMQPFTDKIIMAKARQGIKNILVVAPSFVADCLETTVEIGFEYRKLFQEHGGQNLQLVDSLNDSPDWIAALKSIITE